MRGVCSLALPLFRQAVHGPLFFWNQPKHWPPYCLHIPDGLIISIVGKRRTHLADFFLASHRLATACLSHLPFPFTFSCPGLRRYDLRVMEKWTTQNSFPKRPGGVEMTARVLSGPGHVANRRCLHHHHASNDNLHKAKKASEETNFLIKTNITKNG